MGLNVSHGCFAGAYSAFNRLRKHVASACGGSFPPHDHEFVSSFLKEHDGAPASDHWYFEENEVPEGVRAGMTLFLGHSDCDGTLSPGEARLVADFLGWAANRIPENTDGFGHLGDVKTAVERFARGCAQAAEANETVVFE